MIPKPLVKRRVTVVLLVLLISCLFFQGCIVVLGTTKALIMRMDGRNYFTSTVLMRKLPNEAFDAVIKVVSDTPEVKIIDTIEKNYRIEFKISGTEATIQAIPYDSRLTQLILTANAGEEEQEVKSKLLSLLGQVCEKLGVSYQLDKS